MFQDYLFYGTDVAMRYGYRMLHLSSVLQTAQERHGLSAPRTLLLGDVLLANILLSSILEEDERTNLRIQSGSDFMIAAETTFHAHTRGYFQGDTTSQVVADIDAGKGFDCELTVRSLRAKMGVYGVFEGVSQMRATRIEDAVNDHLGASYQMGAYMKLHCWIDPTNNKPRAFGAIFTEFPDIPVETSRELLDHIESLPPLDVLYNKSEDPDALAAALIPHPTHPVKSINPKWECTCSKEAVEGMMSGLPISEISDMVDKKEAPKIRCHYCNTEYQIPFSRVQEIWEEFRAQSLNQPGSKLRH